MVDLRGEKVLLRVLWEGVGGGLLLRLLWVWCVVC